MHVILLLILPVVVLAGCAGPAGGQSSGDSGAPAPSGSFAGSVLAPSSMTPLEKSHWCHGYPHELRC